MTLGDWCDIAWSAIFDESPALANPGEFRRMMYEAFWEGKAPTPPPKSGRSGARSGPQEPPTPSSPPRHAINALEAERKRILAIQAERQANN